MNRNIEKVTLYNFKKLCENLKNDNNKTELQNLAFEMGLSRDEAFGQPGLSKEDLCKRIAANLVMAPTIEIPKEADDHPHEMVKQLCEKFHDDYFLKEVYHWGKMTGIPGIKDDMSKKELCAFLTPVKIVYSSQPVSGIPPKNIDMPDAEGPYAQEIETLTNHVNEIISSNYPSEGALKKYKEMAELLYSRKQRDIDEERLREKMEKFYYLTMNPAVGYRGINISELIPSKTAPLLSKRTAPMKQNTDNIWRILDTKIAEKLLDNAENTISKDSIFLNALTYYKGPDFKLINFMLSLMIGGKDYRPRNKYQANTSYLKSLGFENYEIDNINNYKYKYYYDRIESIKTNIKWKIIKNYKFRNCPQNFPSIIGFLVNDAVLTNKPLDFPLNLYRYGFIEGDIGTVICMNTIISTAFKPDKVDVIFKVPPGYPNLILETDYEYEVLLPLFLMDGTIAKWQIVDKVPHRTYDEEGNFNVNHKKSTYILEPYYENKTFVCGETKCLGGDYITIWEAD